MIELQNVHFHIGPHHIIRDVSFVVGRGQTLVILGASGSGKSTLLRLIMGLIRPDSGRVLIDGQDTTRMSLGRLREMRKNIGMVFQEGALFDSMTVGENIGYALFEGRRIPVDEIEARVRDILNYLGLGEELIDRMPDQLSGGMQRRVAIGRAIAAYDPRIMLYDEPTTGLDPITVDTITELICRLRDEKQMSSVVVTHEIVDALKVADRFLVISRGEVRFDGDVDQLRESREDYVVEYLAPFRRAIREHAII
jgi:phospholipid/cholesterol/gamma-HCH transport system ATP-binding protein